MTDLFDVERPRKTATVPAAPDSPLADRMRPRSLDEVEGPEEVVGSNGFLRRALAEDRVPSLIFWGPPGVGKTTLARLIATQTSSVFLAYSAIATGVKEMREVLEGARKLRAATRQRTILFLDEIHRFNRAQQDVFLPYIESGDIVLIGATTENPSFELNGALLSRCKVVVLDPLLPEAVARIVRRALQDFSRGLGARDFKVDDEALSFIAQTSGGDARRALNLLEAAATDAEAGKTQRLEVSRLRDLLQRKVLLYDKAGEEHYNLISALHKSMRESDPDATIYWLVRMLEAGEEPLYLARRIVRFASEDIGLADPRALRVALDAKEAFDFLGLPEGSLALAEAAVYCALAPKSNALYEAEGEAKRDVAEKPAEPVPSVIRNAVTQFMKQAGYGQGYRYAHAEPEGVGGIECLPESLKGRRYYRPRASGEEAELARRLEVVLQRRRQKWNQEEGDESDRKKRKSKSNVIEARSPVTAPRETAGKKAEAAPSAPSSQPPAEGASTAKAPPTEKASGPDTSPTPGKGLPGNPPPDNRELTPSEETPASSATIEGPAGEPAAPLIPSSTPGTSISADTSMSSGSAMSPGSSMSRSTGAPPDPSEAATAEQIVRRDLKVVVGESGAPPPRLEEAEADGGEKVAKRPESGRETEAPGSE